MKNLSPLSNSVFAHKNIEEIKKEKEGLEKAASGFESMFTKFLYNKLGESTQQEDLTGEISNARKIFNGMLTDEFAELASQKGGLGLKELILSSYGFEPEREGSILGRNFNNPIKGVVSSDFGARVHPISGEKTFHYGVDIVPDPNVKDSDLIKSPLPGKVIFSGKYGSYGNVVVLLHPGSYKTIYAHNEENMVTYGETVNKGQVIGKVGSTGQSTAKHLHFELRKELSPIDPSIIM